jgi:serpin B
MKRKLHAWALLLVLGASMLSGCGMATMEPTPAGPTEPTPAAPSEPTPAAPSEPTPAAPSEGAVPVPDPILARDAALAYVAEAFGDQAPAPGLAWEAENTTPEGLVGRSDSQYRAGDWVTTVSFPVVAPQAIVYEVVVSNAKTDFRWEGEVDAWGRVSQTSSSTGGAVAVLGPIPARDAALAHLAEAYGQRVPALDITWTEEETTPEGLVGSSGFCYSAEEWVIEVAFNLVAPQDTVYSVAASNEASGFRWKGEVDAAGQVKDVAEPAGQEGKPVEVSGADLAELVRGNSAFAFDLYQVLREGDGNLFFSPYSISAALAMTYAGARGETEIQMTDALQFLLGQERLHPAFQALDGELAARGEGAEGKDGEGFRLHVVNALWGQEGYAFLPEFLDLLSAHYGAGLRLLDFVGAAEEARVTINDWVAEQTEGRIEDLIPPGVLDALTRLVLTNAIYFNAAWAEPFEAERTEDGAFHLLDGEEMRVPMMVQSESLGYAEGEGYQAVELLYDGREMSMVILLPEPGAFDAFEGTLDAEAVEAILQNMSTRAVALTLPRFEFEAELSLKEALAGMGMEIAFTADADFSGMTGTRELSIAEVLHKAFVSVDEAGTEAAAATAVVMKFSAAPAEPVQVVVDRPFVFLIRDIETGAILFVGRVLDPS